MADVSQLPTWAVYAVALGSPLAAFVGAPVANVMTRRSARELERRSKREEVLRTMRWAAELAVSDDDRQAQLGVSQLRALLTSDLLGVDEKALVQDALTSAVSEPVESLPDPEGADHPPGSRRDGEGETRTLRAGGQDGSRG